MKFEATPLVSVIVPVYNVGGYLKGCLDSIIHQTLKDIEIICVDDGSIDNSAEILKEYAQKDKRIKVIHQKNKGQAAARNAGIEKAIGKYLFFVDSDDKLHTKALEIFTHIAKETNAPITVSNTCIKSSKKQKTASIPDKREIAYKVHKNALHDCLRKKYMSSWIWNKLFKRELFKNWRFIEGIKFEDWPLITCLFSEIPFYVSFDVPLYFYTDTNTSTVRSPFSVVKIQNYVTGIKFVYQYYQKPDKVKYWRDVQKIRIYQSMKMVLSKVSHSKENKKELVEAFFKNFQELYGQNIICLSDFSLKSLYRLLKVILYPKK